MSTQIEWSLAGKTAIITGANSGIGKATAKLLAEAQVNRIILACRKIEAGKQAAQEIQNQLALTDGAIRPKIECWQLDLASFFSIKRFANDFLNSNQPLHLLICNAGIIAKPDHRELTRDGFEVTFQTNYLGHYFLTRLLLAKLIESAPSRVVIVSSKRYKKCGLSGLDLEDPNQEKRSSYCNLRAYAQAALANVLFAKQLHEVCRLSHAHPAVTVYCVNPGRTLTKLYQNCSKIQKLTINVPLTAKNPEKGVIRVLHCASKSGIEELSGKFFSKCQQEETESYANDSAMALELWNMSERMTLLAGKSHSRASSCH